MTRRAARASALAAIAGLLAAAACSTVLDAGKTGPRADGGSEGAAAEVGSPRLTDDELELVFNDESVLPPVVRLARRDTTT